LQCIMCHHEADTILKDLMSQDHDIKIWCWSVRDKWCTRFTEDLIMLIIRRLLIENDDVIEGKNKLVIILAQ